MRMSCGAVLRRLFAVHLSHLLKAACAREKILKKTFAKSSIIWYHMLISFEERSPQIIIEYRARLEEKLRELLADNQLDDSRIAQEVTIFADKICVDEETVRLKSHILSMKDSLNAGGSVGRKLDFLAQEMNREANTILSKSNDLKISDTGISLKTDIEKVREQIQNIE